MNVSERIRYTVDMVERSIFLMIPKFLFFDEEFMDLTDTARMLYGLLHEQHEISLENDLFDDDGNVYIFFTRKEMCEILRKSEKTITNAMKELKNHKLIDEVQVGLHQPNQIYLLAVENL